MTGIVNGAPLTNFLGVDDKSSRTPVREVEAIPSHLAKVYIFAKEGPTDPQLVSGNSRSRIYGADSFDPRKPWATHTTILSNALNAKANPQIIQRLRPADAPDPSNLRISLDMLFSKAPEYQRNLDGTYKLDAAGAKIPTGNTIDQYSLKWVSEHIDAVAGESQFGRGVEKAGDQVDGSVQSVRIPWMDLEVSSFGSWGDNVGLRMYSPTVQSSTPVSERMIDAEKVYPFRVACVRRADYRATPKAVATTNGELSLNLCFRPGTIDRAVDTEVYIGDRFISEWSDKSPADGGSPIYGPFGRLHVYEANVDRVIKMLYAAEVAAAGPWGDFRGEDDEEYRYNILGLVSSGNIPYHTARLVTTGSGAIRWTENSTVYATGGGDGTMNEQVLGQLVADEVREYGNELSPLMNMARNPEAIIYDTGFPLETKYALCNFIAIRKDTAVVLSTYDVLGEPLTASEESSLAVALRTRLQQFPESEYFGTETLRGAVVGRHGRMLDKQYRKDLPLTIEFAAKMAEYMGAANGKWDSTKSPDESPNNEVNMFGDINVTFTPARVKNKDWANGLVWVESSGLRTNYFPALRTVYPDDTSVLTSFITMMACVELEKIGERVRQKFSGNSKLTGAQLIDRVNREVREMVAGRFDNRFIIEPETYFTAADEAAGYRWTLKIKIGAANMKTVQTLIIESLRIEDMAA